MKPKDIFGLAVRLLGLLFLYLGLKAATQMLDLDVIESPDKSDLINALLPVAFNLAVAWWLLGGGLTRRAYPETPRASERAPAQPERTVPAPTTAPAPAPEPSRLEQAEDKLAALVEKPKARQPV